MNELVAVDPNEEAKLAALLGGNAKENTNNARLKS